jgi:integrase
LTTTDAEAELLHQNHTQELSSSSSIEPQKQRIYPITEGIRSIKTAIVYERCFNHFRDHIKIHDKQVLLDFSPKVIKQMLVDYVLYLRDEKPGKKLSRASIKVHLAAILHFFQINNDDFNLTIHNFRIHLPSDDFTKDDRPYTTEEIGQVLQDCDVRSKVVVLLLCSSGMRIGALHSLQIGDLTSVTCQGLNLYKIQVYARTRDKYYTFCTPECTKAITEYLEYRKRFGENISIISKAPLIREQFNKDNPFTINSPRFVSEKGIEHLIENVLNKSGVRKPGVVHLSHGFRKHFMTECERSGMKSIDVKMLMGHNIGVSGHYYRPAESDILEDYMTHAANALTIDPNQRLKQENAELRKTQSDYLAELGDLRHDFNEMKQLLVHLNKDSQKQLIDELSEKVRDKADIEWSCDD